MPEPVYTPLVSFLARRTKEFQGELALTQTVRAEGNDSLGTRGEGLLNQTKPAEACPVAEACPSWASCALFALVARGGLGCSGYCRLIVVRYQRSSDCHGPDVQEDPQLVATLFLVPTHHEGSRPVSAGVGWPRRPSRAATLPCHHTSSCA
jgi:hypothetical protein